jgi:predicted MFS family arabinose efflux permease
MHLFKLLVLHQKGKKMFILRYYIRLICFVTHYVRPSRQSRIDTYANGLAAFMLAQGIIIFVSLILIVQFYDWKDEKVFVILSFSFFILLSVSRFTHEKLWIIEYRKAYRFIISFRKKRITKSK